MTTLEILDPAPATTEVAEYRATEAEARAAVEAALFEGGK